MHRGGVKAKKKDLSEGMAVPSDKSRHFMQSRELTLKYVDSAAHSADYSLNRDLFNHKTGKKSMNTRKTEGEKRNIS